MKSVDALVYSNPLIRLHLGVKISSHRVRSPFPESTKGVRPWPIYHRVHRISTIKPHRAQGYPHNPTFRMHSLREREPADGKNLSTSLSGPKAHQWIEGPRPLMHQCMHHPQSPGNITAETKPPVPSQDPSSRAALPQNP